MLFVDLKCLKVRIGVRISSINLAHIAFRSFKFIQACALLQSEQLRGDINIRI